MQKEINPIEKMNYYWIAIYKDNTMLSQYEDKDGKTILNSFYDIDQSKLDFFVIKNSKGKETWQLEFDPNTMKLIWYWDKYIVPGNNELLKVEHCMGYQMNMGGKQVKMILHISEDGTTTITTR